MKNTPNQHRYLVIGRETLKRSVTGFTVMIFLTLLTVAAQELSGQIKGTVADSNGAGIPRANITATHVETNSVYRATTSDDGAFTLPGVRLGRYTVAVEASSFRRTVIHDIKVELGGVAQLTVTLQVGPVQELVEITGGQAQEVINSTNAELGAVVDDRRVLELPLNGRNAAHLALLQAGVILSAPPTEKAISSSCMANATVRWASRWMALTRRTTLTALLR
jgi:hypothetical protein